MRIGGIAWWLLVGMFGWGAAVGLGISLLIARWIIKPEGRDPWEPTVAVIQAFIFTFAGIVLMPLAGIVAVVLAFVAHRIGWDRPLPYLAGIGFVFLLALASWILWIACKPSPARRQKEGSFGLK